MSTESTSTTSTESADQIEPFERRFSEKGVVARPTGITGWGLYADRVFLPGEPIFWVNLLEEDRAAILYANEAFGDCTERSATLLPDFAYCMSIEHPFWNVNHSCEGNAGFANWGRAESGRLAFVAYREICAGEQITCDYSYFTTSYEGSPEGDPWEMQGCLCGSPECRGTITGFHALPRELQLRAIIPVSAPFGRVTAHVLAEEPEVAEALKAYPMQYHAFLEVLEQQREYMNYLHSRLDPFRHAPYMRHG